MPLKVIVDSDWGGDELQLMSVLLAHPKQVEVIGCTTSYGNVSLEQTTQNCGDILHFLGAINIPYFKGASEPLNGKTEDKDFAHGDNGLGGVDLLPTPMVHEREHAVDFILRVLAQEPADSVVILANAALTNLATAYHKAPDTMRRLKGTHIMGGCTEQMPAHDMPIRQGNITPYAEFNFYQAPEDAKIIMESDLNIKLFPMNCTHQMTYTIERQKQLATVFLNNNNVGSVVHRLTNAPVGIDKAKFNISAVMHDVHTALELIYPQQYKKIYGDINVRLDGVKRGMTELINNKISYTQVCTDIRDSDFLFDKVLDSFKYNLIDNVVLGFNSDKKLEP